MGSRIFGICCPRPAAAETSRAATMSGAAAVNRLNDAYLARLETLARMTTNGIISVNEGKKFRAEAKKLWKQEVKLHNMPGAPPSVASVEDEDNESYDVNGDEDEEEYQVDRSPTGFARAQAMPLPRAHSSHFLPPANQHRAKQSKEKWPVTSHGDNLIAETYPNMAAGRQSVKAAFQAHTLYAGVTQANFSSRSRKHPAGAGVGGRHYADWEVMDASTGELYGCRCHQPSHPSPLTPQPLPLTTHPSHQPPPPHQ